MPVRTPIKNEIKSRLAALGKTQKDLFIEINKRGLRISTVQQFYQYINESVITPKAEQTIEVARKILNDWESINKINNNV